MNYPCNLIRDLLPLYHDEALSEESVHIIENHLSECAFCQKYYASLCEADEIVVMPLDADRELKKAASFQAVKRKLLRKQFFIGFIVFVLLTVSVLVAIGVLKRSTDVIEYDENNISVSATDGSLIGRLRGNQANYCRIKRVEITSDGQMHTYLFFYLSGTKWDTITTGPHVVSEYVLCPADKGAEQIDTVYYYTGNYTGIEDMSGEEIQKVIDASISLWSR